jgi:SAM-dependent methyltransferase
MKIDIRAEAARYYDSNPDFVDDVPFYRALIPAPDASILELGCGTGRVTTALIPYCGFIQGIDLSTAMLSICRKKLAQAGIPPSKASVEEGDISDFDLGRAFDLIIAPFRVLQNLETDEQVNGLFRCIHMHLARGGTCILNVFRPNAAPGALRKQWTTPEETLSWVVPVEGGRLACYDRRTRMDPDRLVLYPELVYRRYEGETLAEESILRIAMRCYYPDAFEKLITDHGFAVLNRWGGYEGEVYGQGPELVIQFGETTSAARAAA